jgi:O-antigen/teichoic acid export membrane protein
MLWNTWFTTSPQTSNERHPTMNFAYLQFLIIPLIFACASVSMAKGKNRNPVVWFFIGLFTGPIALALILFMKPGPGEDQGYE